MKEIVPGVHLLRGLPPAAFNVYLVRSGGETALVDTATRHARRRILGQLPGGLDAIVITHAHVDHAGAMHAVAQATAAPVWGGERDADALEGRAPVPLPAAHRGHLANRLGSGWWKEPHPVSRLPGRPGIMRACRSRRAATTRCGRRSASPPPTRR